MHIPSADEMTTVSHLTSLHVRFELLDTNANLDQEHMVRQPVQAVLGHLCAPNLEKLHLDVIDSVRATGSAEFDIAQTVLFLDKSGTPDVQQIIITRMSASASPEDLVALLAAMPSLEHLVVVCLRQSITDAMLEFVAGALIAFSPTSTSPANPLLQVVSSQIQQFTESMTRYGLTQLQEALESYLASTRCRLWRILM